MSPAGLSLRVRGRADAASMREVVSDPRNDPLFGEEIGEPDWKSDEAVPRLFARADAELIGQARRN